MFRPLAIAILATAFALPAVAAETPLDFVTKAAQSDMFEIKTSELALQKSKNVNVRAFAERMIADHTKASAALKTAAEADKIKLPTALEADLQTRVDELSTAGDGFDVAYVDIQADVHEKSVALYADYARDGEAGHVKTYATDTLNTLKMHKERIILLDQKM